MATLGFEKLEVYRLAENLADRVWDIVANWDHFARSTVGGQHVTAADSIGANIAEGCGRYHYKDNKRFVRIARGSLYETHNWLRRAYKRKLIDAAEADILRPILEELRPRLNAYLKSIGPRDSKPPTNDK